VLPAAAVYTTGTVGCIFSVWTRSSGTYFVDCHWPIYSWRGLPPPNLLLPLTPSDDLSTKSHRTELCFITKSSLLMGIYMGGYMLTELRQLLRCTFSSCGWMELPPIEVLSLLVASPTVALTPSERSRCPARRALTHIGLSFAAAARGGESTQGPVLRFDRRKVPACLVIEWRGAL